MPRSITTFDRGWGKASQAVEMDVREDPLEKLSGEELDELKEQFRTSGNISIETANVHFRAKAELVIALRCLPLTQSAHCVPCRP
jgi:hypothetical protein